MWFETLTGFKEQNPEQVRDNISVDGEVLRSQINGKEYICGILETPTLAELRKRVHAAKVQTGKLSIREIVEDVRRLHTDGANAGALFQVASQFNLLEMASPGGNTGRRCRNI